MKTSLISMACIVALLGTILQSCENGVSTGAKLKTESDTLSYALGMNYYDWSDLGSFIDLPQRGLISDTTTLYSQYVYKINSAKDESEKMALKKEMRNKLDSVIRQNDRNLAEFAKGIIDVMQSPETRDAYNYGTMVGTSVKKSLLPLYIEERFGSKEDIFLINEDIFLEALTTMVRKQKAQIENPDEIVGEASRKLYD